MKFRFPKVKGRLKKLIRSGSTRHGVRLTPQGTDSHVRIGTIDGEFRAISIQESTECYILVDLEKLEAGISDDDDTISIQINAKNVKIAKNMIETEISGNKRLQKKVNKGSSDSRKDVFRRNPVRSKEEKRLLRKYRELRKENQRLNRVLNKDAGTIIEMFIPGLLPMREMPPIPLQNIHRMHYGCDWLSIVWDHDILNLYLIESNLSRTGGLPSLSANERRFREAVKMNRVKIHYAHQWVDGNGNIHWES